MIEKDGEKIVLDTTYKEFKSIDDFSKGDVFQVSTYCLLHNAKHAIVLYPQCQDERDYMYYLNTQYDDDENKKDYKIEFKTINLKHSEISDEIIKENIVKVLGTKA